MNREEAYIAMLESTAKMQSDIAIILEAKAAEAEKMRAWVCNHLFSHSLDSHPSQLGQSIQIHEQVLETIDGITKVNQSMVSIMKAVLDKEDGQSELGQLEGFGSKI